MYRHMNRATPVLSVFCADLGLPDPRATLVARARADVVSFQREIVACIERSPTGAAWLPVFRREAPTHMGAMLDDWQMMAHLDGSSGDPRYLKAVAHVRALAEALGQDPLPPVPDGEERAVALRLAKLAAQVAADHLRALGRHGRAVDVERATEVTDDPSARRAVDALARADASVDGMDHVIYCAWSACNYLLVKRAHLGGNELVADRCAAAVRVAGPYAVERARLLVEELACARLADQRS